jgi:Tfp pilus assembly protein PilO
MDFPGQKNNTAHESYFFDFVTTCINDLKLQLVSVKPLRPVVKGPVTTYGYDIVIEGDFFKFGELCAKFENSRRIVSLETFSVDLMTNSQGKIASAETKGIRVTMRVNTYRIKKETINEE